MCHVCRTAGKKSTRRCLNLNIRVTRHTANASFPQRLLRFDVRRTLPFSTASDELIKGVRALKMTLSSFSFIVYSAGARCCVHNAPPVVTNSCLPPGRCKANVLLAKVCRHCTKPGVASGRASNLEAAHGSQQRQHGGGPLVVSCGQYVQRDANVCPGDQVGERMASDGCSDRM